MSAIFIKRHASVPRQKRCWCYTSRWPCNLEVIHIRMARLAWDVCWMARKACPGISISGSGRWRGPDRLSAMHGTCEQGAQKSCARRSCRDSKEHGCLPSSDESIAITFTRDAENGTRMISNYIGYNWQKFLAPVGASLKNSSRIPPFSCLAYPFSPLFSCP